MKFMREIRMVDLISQYKKIEDEVNQAVINVMNRAAFIKGPEVYSFEENLAKYLNVKHAIGVANGTDALQIAMMALDLQPGDEVITASFTYVATAEVIALLKLTPVLVDVNEDDFTLDIEQVKKAITPKTKAIVPVHLFGQCAAMEELMELADKHGLYVIEDNAQAIGCDYFYKNGQSKKTGTIGHIGCTSFFPSKNLGCFGDGGAIFTNDDHLAQKIRMIANHGQSKQYYHDMIGVNSRLDTIQAAILDIKLKHLDEYNHLRQKAADFYDKKFSGHSHIITPKRNKHSKHVFHQYTLRITNGQRDQLKTHLQEKGIPSMIYYPVPLHQQKAYRDARYEEGNFPITERLCREVLSLPMHTELDQEQLNYITDSVLEFFN